MGAFDVSVRMQTTVTNLLKLIRQPEYTGENRCFPCTTVNALIAIVLSGLLFAFTTPIVGGIAFAVFITTIYLRGYLVPGTPELTKRYLPNRIHRLFGSHVEGIEADGDIDGEGASEGVESLLRSTGVVVDCAEEEDLCLELTFRTAWRERIATLEDEDARLAALAGRLGLEEEELALEESTGGYVARYEGDRIGIWPAEAAFLADLAATPALDEHGSGWQELTGEEQGVVLTGLRAFLEECPTCGGEIGGKEETVESCCSTVRKMAVECGDCGARLLRGTA